jgi:hypothetical protein
MHFVSWFLLAKHVVNHKQRVKEAETAIEKQHSLDAGKYPTI